MDHVKPVKTHWSLFIVLALLFLACVTWGDWDDLLFIRVLPMDSFVMFEAMSYTMEEMDLIGLFVWCSVVEYPPSVEWWHRVNQIHSEVSSIDISAYQ